ncbi:MAG: glycosyltransferase [Bryobacterales bacterium]|nr:glycosyltransferase [Bryobacterales bacterium]
MTPQLVKVAVASGSEDLIPTLVEKMQAIAPEMPLYVVSEFKVDGAHWIPYHLGRTLQQNLALVRSALKGKRIAYSAVILQPRMPYWQMRLLGFRLGGLKTIFFNEQLDHWMLRPASAGTIARHFLWRGGNLVRWELQPGGATYTFFWRLAHPQAFLRPLRVLRARFLGWLLAWEKRTASPRPLPAVTKPLEPGVSVVIPSRNGRDLLARLLPGLVEQLAGYPHEVIVVDNGSDDRTATWLAAEFPTVRLIEHPAPLSFSAAVNRGIHAAQFDRLLMINNDMVIEPNFFPPLLDAFQQVPDLFCATAQILFPPGVRREETGKAVMPVERAKADFPLTCDLPLEGENLTPVLYGSGGCSMFDTRKLLQLGGLDEIYSPAYVEDLDLGVRGWRQNWPTVFVAGARLEHRHRATTSRYFTPAELDRVLEVNYLRFLVRAFGDPNVFFNLWTRAIDRLNLRAAQQEPDPAATAALHIGSAALPWRSPIPAAVVPESRVLAIGAGDIANFPGRPATGRPVILIASPYLPFPLAHGGAVRMYNLMREAAKDFDLVLLSFAGQLAPPPQELLELCAEIVLVRRHASHLRPLTDRPSVVDEFDTESFRGALQLAIRRWHTRIVQLEFTQLALYAKDCHPARTIMVEHDVTLDLYRQLLEKNGDDWETAQQHQRWRRFELDAWKQVDVVVTMSEKDRRAVCQEGAVDNVVTLANGVDLDRFRPSIEAPEPARLLFIGSFAHLPNVLAVDFFLRQCWPLIRGHVPEAALHIIAGSRHQYFLDHYRDKVQPPLDASGIAIEDFVSDPRPAYRRAAVVVAPLLASAGTNIKIMEAMAMGKAIVSTPGGINGLDDLRPGHDLLVGRTATEFAQAAVHLLTDSDARQAIESRARATVAQRYSWTSIGTRQRELYLKLLQS